MAPERVTPLNQIYSPTTFLMPKKRGIKSSPKLPMAFREVVGGRQVVTEKLKNLQLNPLSKDLLNLKLQDTSYH
jgi:hypothetical protein